MGKLLKCLPRLSLAQLRLTLRSTTVCTCRRGLNFSHRPDGNIADVLMPRLFLQTTLWSTTQNVRVKVTLKGSHRPDGKITDVLASTLARTTAADTLVNYSLMYVPQRPVFSHRPDGNIADVLMPRLFLQTTLWSTTERACHSDLQRFPSPPWETHVLLVACRAVVLLSWEAQCQS